jgi:hypothetical protein
LFGEFFTVFASFSNMANTSVKLLSINPKDALFYVQIDTSERVFSFAYALTLPMIGELILSGSQTKDAVLLSTKIVAFGGHNS